MQVNTNEEHMDASSSSNREILYQTTPTNNHLTEFIIVSLLSVQISHIFAAVENILNPTLNCIKVCPMVMSDSSSQNCLETSGSMFSKSGTIEVSCLC